MQIFSDEFIKWLESEEILNGICTLKFRKNGDEIEPLTFQVEVGRLINFTPQTVIHESMIAFDENPDDDFIMFDV